MCNEKKKMLYDKAELEIIKLSGADVIATSGGLGELEENTPGDTWQ
jgi:hypothetical protein